MDNGRDAEQSKQVEHITALWGNLERTATRLLGEYYVEPSAIHYLLHSVRALAQAKARQLREKAEGQAGVGDKG